MLWYILYVSENLDDFYGKLIFTQNPFFDYVKIVNYW